MKTNYVEVAQKVVNKIEEIRKELEPRYSGGWKVCRYGTQIGMNLVREYPLIADLVQIEEELKKESFSYFNSQDSFNGVKNFIAVILQLFPNPEETVKIYKGEKEKKKLAIKNN